MIILKLTDGLGNQMFQYAFGRQLQRIYGMPMLLETARFRKQVRRMGLQALAIPLVDRKPTAQQCRIATELESAAYRTVSQLVMRYAGRLRGIPFTGPDGYRRMIRLGHYTTEDSTSYYPFERTNAKTIFVRGYFQSEKYFHDAAPVIQKELRVKAVSGGEVERLGERMARENSVCVHIRRGDYIGHPKFDVCGETYYRNAAEYLRARVESPRLYVFSNSPEDLDWIRREYPFLSDAHFVKEGRNEFDDLYLMYHCRHHVISNSTFGWWGAYLKTAKGMTLCPSRWDNVNARQDIEMEDWIRIQV